MTTPRHAGRRRRETAVREFLPLVAVASIGACEYPGFLPGTYAPVPVTGVQITSTAVVIAPGEQLAIRTAPI
jgi:hypothetical protein